MKHITGIGMFLLCAALSAACGAEDASRFDGNWDTILSCGNADGALGFSFEFPATVKEGKFHASKGEQGRPGWLEIKGGIEPGGAAKLYASGLVGAHQYAVGDRPAGTQYGYHIDARFKADEGTGKRVEGRPCDVTFTKKQAP